MNQLTTEVLNLEADSSAALFKIPEGIVKSLEIKLRKSQLLERMSAFTKKWLDVAQPNHKTVRELHDEAHKVFKYLPEQFSQEVIDIVNDIPDLTLVQRSILMSMTYKPIAEGFNESICDYCKILSREAGEKSGGLEDFLDGLQDMFKKKMN